MSEKSNDLSSLFISAVVIHCETERQKFVQQLCLGTPELGEQLQILLAGHGRAGSFLARPLDPLAATRFDIRGRFERRIRLGTRNWRKCIQLDRKIGRLFATARGTRLSSRRKCLANRAT